ncbi:class I SAM-dependent methyltransferase [Paenibacillus psychroresistens]|uniref:Class I SAM-dependent methyltransferase n=1 Tax=Paenibacillus psychroresistens TaxID=1778678 RepID=A0A6B8RSB2_9BACL|nr:class I SAM-dependent methyltransferase [Paenibacillus psychroresistens]QGQ98704.1 class I SAM-dependent methyltransferase [Paenibacillus psychroresistens]
MQDKQTEMNRLAWNTKAYDAWLIEYGAPAEEADKLVGNPQYPLRRWLKYIGEPKGQRIINLLGSTGRKAISLAILGADVTIVDISEDNKRYALEVSEAAGVKVEYINADVLNIPNEEDLRGFDLVLMEFGILHYFSDLRQLFAIVARMLKTNGRFILTDFHPVATKLIDITGDKAALKSDADYFQSKLLEGTISFHGILPEEERNDLPPVMLRKWTLGEILSALASEGMYLRILEEEPNKIHSQFPEFYTVIADKIVANSPLIPVIKQEV